MRSDSGQDSGPFRIAACFPPRGRGSEWQYAIHNEKGEMIDRVEGDRLTRADIKFELEADAAQLDKLEQLMNPKLAEATPAVRTKEQRK